MRRCFARRLVVPSLLSLLAASDIAAAGGGRQVLLLPLDAELGGIALPRGYYRVSWSEQGDSATVRIEKDGKPFVEAAGARLLPAEAQATDRIGLVRPAGSPPDLARIQLADRRFALDLRPAVARRIDGVGDRLARAAASPGAAAD